MRIIEIAYLNVSLIGLEQSTVESNRLETNWDIVRTDDISCHWSQVRAIQLCKRVDRLPDPKGSDDRFGFIWIVSLKQPLER